MSGRRGIILWRCELANFLCPLALVAGFSLVSHSAQAADALELRISSESEVISLVLANHSTRSLNGSEGYALSGLSGGNVVPVVVTNFGQLMPPCGHMHSWTEIAKAVPIEPGRQVVIWKGTAGIIAGLHCLEAGRYSLAFTYVAPDGSLVFTTNSLALLVGENFSARIQP